MNAVSTHYETGTDAKGSISNVVDTMPPATIVARDA